MLQALGADLERRGHRVLLNEPVEQIVIEGGRVQGVRVGERDPPRRRGGLDGHHLRGSGSSPRTACSGPFVESLEKIPTIGIFCLFLRLTRPVTPFFWVNANDPRVPFAGMIEYTNLNPVPELGGDHVLYVPQYLSADDPRYGQSDEEVLRKYTDALALIHPAFDPTLDPVLRGVPRPLRPAHLPHRLPGDHPGLRDPGGRPVPDRLLPAPPPRPVHQRQLRPGAAGGGAGLEDALGRAGDRG